MQFEFQNLGTIEKTTLDLRPLTVILGPNNTSKTYLAYSVHGLLGAMRAARPVSPPGAEVDLRRVVQVTQTAVHEAAKRFALELPRYFQDTRGGLFRRAALDVHVDEDEVRAALERLSSEPDSGLSVRSAKVVVADRGSRLTLDLVGSIILHLPGMAAALTLPAERNAFIITYKMLSARRYRVLRDRARGLATYPAVREGHDVPASVLREPTGVRYPEPIEGFLDFLTDVELEGVPNDASSPFSKLARVVEQALQGGHRTSYVGTEVDGRELAVTLNGDLVLDLYNASSSIKQIAPLLLYLRYSAAPNQTLIIDEPEMNLHPEAQAKLLEALAMLANLGVRVLLTTHSPYFMAHLNNLIAADPASLARKKRQARHLYTGDPAAFLSPDDVSAYEMRPDGLSSLKDPEYGIRWDTLSDVSAELQRRYFAIVEEPKRRAKAA